MAFNSNEKWELQEGIAVFGEAVTCRHLAVQYSKLFVYCDKRSYLCPMFR
jgi:hypothetical protein